MRAVSTNVVRSPLAFALWAAASIPATARSQPPPVRMGALPGGVLEQISDSLQQLARKVSPAVVQDAPPGMRPVGTRAMALPALSQFHTRRLQPSAWRTCDSSRSRYDSIASAETRRLAERVTYETASAPINTTGSRNKGLSPAR